MTLTRRQFDLACKAYLSKYSRLPTVDTRVNDDLLQKFPAGWTWNEHHLVRDLGFLSRSATIPCQNRSTPPITDAGFEVVEVEDVAATSATPESLTCLQYVVYSPTFQVPAFYFSLHGSNGAPLPLQDIAASRLFVRSALPDTNPGTFALEVPESAFAMLSQGDHPTLTTPCWYLHPCHTAEVVDEIMRELPRDGEDRPLRWLEAWFMMLGNAVDLRVGS